MVAGFVHAIGAGKSVTAAPLTGGLTGVKVELAANLLVALFGISQAPSPR